MFKPVQLVLAGSLLLMTAACSDNPVKSGLIGAGAGAAAGATIGAVTPMTVGTGALIGAGVGGAAGLLWPF